MLPWLPLAALCQSLAFGALPPQGGPGAPYSLGRGGVGSRHALAGCPAHTSLQENLRQYVDRIFSIITKSGVSCPTVMCDIFFSLREAAAKRFQGESSVARLVPVESTHRPSPGAPSLLVRTSQPPERRF